MTNDSRNEALQQAIREWQRKHAIADDDPILATGELWEILLKHERPPDTASPYHRFRQELEHLEQIAQSFSTQSGEMICELRAVPKIKNDLWLFPYFTVVFVAIGALVTGIIVGKFLL